MINNKPSNIKSFDYLKTIAILMIVVTHLSFSEITRKNLRFPYWIDMAVPIFFIISGYVYSLSADKRKLESIKDWFKFDNFSNKFLRIFIPYLIIIIIEVLLYKINNRYLSSREIVNGFFTGGWGPGSYYFPVLLQLLFLFPFILFITKTKYGWLVLVLIQILLEIISQKFAMSDLVYRLLFFRYLGFVTFGILLYLDNAAKYKGFVSKITNNKYYLSLMFLLGIGTIFLLNYSLYQPYLFKRWTTTSLPVVLYCLPLVVVFMKAERLLNKIPKVLDRVILIIAKSTFHIFLIQMTYYWFKGSEDLRLRNSFLLSLIICIPLGILFYYLESLLTEKLFKKK